MSEVLDILNAYNVDIDYDIFRVTPVDHDRKRYERWQRIELGRALSAFKFASYRNAPEEDLFSAWCYLKVCVEAVKPGSDTDIDIDKAKMVFGIKELSKKYSLR